MPIVTKTVKVNPKKYFKDQKKRGRDYRKSQQEEQETPPVTTVGSVYESEGYEEHTTTAGTPATRPGETSGPIDTPVVQTGGVVAPPYSRGGGTATVDELKQVDHSRGGIITNTLPVSQQEQQQQQQSAVRRAEYRAEERTPSVIDPWQERLQAGAQQVAQDEYERLMNYRARSVGMTYDAASGTWMYSDPRQLALYQQYSPTAEQLAKQKAQEYYENRFAAEQPLIAQELSAIYGEEYEKTGFVLVEQSDGSYQVIPKQEYERQQQYKDFKYQYEQKYGDIESQGPVEKLGYLLQLAGHGLSAENPLGLKTIYESYLSPTAGRKERVLNIHARAQFAFEQSIQEYGPVVGIGKKWVEPGSPLFTAGVAYGGGAAFGAAFGAIAQVSKTAASLAQIGVGGYFAGRGITEAQSIWTKGFPVKYGGFLGLIPVGIQKTSQSQPLSPAERFAAVGMMGFAVPFAYRGYKTGYKYGQAGMAKLYQPKYTNVFDETYPTLEKVTENKYVQVFKGRIKYRTSRQRIIFGRTLPFKESTWADLPVRGMTAKKELSMVSGTGKTGVWKAGETVYTLGAGKIFRTRLGRIVSQDYKGGDLFKAMPTRPLTVQAGKTTGISIEPYVQKTAWGYVFADKPKMSLTMTPKQIGTSIFKSPVESQFYPSFSAANTTITKAITQVWQPTKSVGVLKTPRKVPIAVKFVEPGEKVPGYPLDTRDVYGFTKFNEPSIYVVNRNFGVTEEPPTDMFGRLAKREPMSAIMRHELMHRRLPWASETEVQALSRRIMPSNKRIIDRQQGQFGGVIFKPDGDVVAVPTYEKGIGIESLKKTHKQTFPEINKAVKNFWKTGELGMYETQGTNIYQVQPFRQISVTKGPTGIITRQTYGTTNILVGTKPTTEITIDAPIKTFAAKQTLTPQDIIQETPVTGKGELTGFSPLKTQISLVEPTIDTGRRSGGLSLPAITNLYKVGSATTTKPQTIQREGFRLTNLQQNLYQQNLTDISKTNLITGSTTGQTEIQIQTQTPQLKTITNLLTGPTTTVTQPTPFMPIGAGVETTNLFTGPPQGYVPQVKRRQYINGKKVRGTEWVNVTNTAYSRDDALAVAAHKADNSAKRSIRVVPSDKKPRRRPKRIDPWGQQLFEYRNKGNGVFVETNMFAIDSPGEVREISMRGAAARRKNGSKPKKRTKNQGVSLKTPSIGGIEKKIRRRLIR